MSSTVPYLRALGAARVQGNAQQFAALRNLLTDADSTVRLNAAAAFARTKDAESTPALIEAAKLERMPYPAVMFVRALAFQDTPETWDAIQVIIRQGRGEELSVSEAARVMAATKDPKFIEGLSILLTSRSWMTRRDGVRGLAAIPTDPAALMMMTFLMEVDPMVRLAVARNARVDVDPVGKRMEWGSVNDRSSLVRAHSFVALTKSSDALLRSRGYAGIREDDIDIRKIIAESLRLHPMESHVTPLLSLLSDPSPEVRAEAVRSLFAMPGQRSFSEISVLAGENQAEVLHALLEAGKAEKIELPRSMLERLLDHRNPGIRNAVKELIG
jgi:HEAT repeat protein